MQAGEYSAARKDFDAIVKLNAAYTQAYYNRGLALQALGDLPAAGADFNKFLELETESSWRQRAQDRLRELDTASALKAQGKLLAQGNAAFNAGQFQEAIKRYSSALLLEPKFIEALYNRAAAYNQLEQSKDAIADLNGVLKLNPKFAQALVERGLAYLALKDYAKAIADFSSGLALDPKFASAYNNRGIAYIALKQNDKARADFDSALQIDPAFARPYFNRGLILESAGNKAAAVADYRRFVELEKDPVWIAKGQAALKNLGQ
jgi:tetratricopeptide (TPR) repeat protein